MRKLRVKALKVEFNDIFGHYPDRSTFRRVKKAYTRHGKFYLREVPLDKYLTSEQRERVKQKKNEEKLVAGKIIKIPEMMVTKETFWIKVKRYLTKLIKFVRLN